MSSDDEHHGARRRGVRLTFISLGVVEGGEQLQPEGGRGLGMFADGKSGGGGGGGGDGGRLNENEKGGGGHKPTHGNDHSKPVLLDGEEYLEWGRRGAAATATKNKIKSCTVLNSSVTRGAASPGGIADQDDPVEEEERVQEERPPMVLAHHKMQQSFRNPVNRGLVAAGAVAAAPVSRNLNPVPNTQLSTPMGGAAKPGLDSSGETAAAGAPVAVSASSNDADFQVLGIISPSPSPSPSPVAPAAATTPGESGPGASNELVGGPFAGFGAVFGAGQRKGGGAAPAGAPAAEVAAARAGSGEKKGKQPATKKTPLPVKLDAGFGNWEKNTKGIGKKLLMKMGFKGRLGKNEDGATRQLEVKLRPRRCGFGFGDFQEATTLRVNREIEAHRQGKTLEQVDAELQPAAALGRPRGRRKARGREVTKSKEEQMVNNGLWKKNASGKKRKRHCTLEERTQRREEEAAEKKDINVTPKQTIVDMRGPQTKLVRSLDDLAPLSRGASGNGGTLKLGQELLHNVGLLARMPETELQALHGRRRAAVDRAQALKKDAADLRKKVDASAERLSRLEKVEAILLRVRDKVEDDPPSVTADDVLRTFHKLLATFPEEYAVFGLAQLMPAIISAVVKRSLGGWSPLQAPTRPAKLLASCKSFLTGTPGVAGGVNGKATRWEGEVAFELLAEDLVLPAMRSALVNDWDVRDPDPPLALVESLVLAGVGDGTVQALLEQAVLPKLTRGVADWNPRTDTVAVHTWVHPWLPRLGSRLAILFPEIRRKFEAFLTREPLDATALGILSPWKNVFDSRSMEALLNKCVAPKLVAELRRSLDINPANQDMAPFDALMMWADFLPPLYMTTILDVEFFPKWLTALHRWLSDTADYAEVAAWYQTWKGRFPQHLRSDPRVMAQFSAALTLMEQVMQDHEHQGVPLPACATEREDYPRMLKLRRKEAAKAQHQRLSRPDGGAAVEDARGGGLPTASFKDVVEEYAVRSSLGFLPKPGRQRDGRQIYVFGGVPVYLDQSVCFAEMPRGSGLWSPLGLEDLLALARSESLTAPAARGDRGA
eukprot:g8655.t2